MKLRNKTTGEIWDIGKIITNDYPTYETLKQINDNFEDYNQPEPLIKDEQVRKAVRAWAELVGADSVNLANFRKFRSFQYEFSIDYDFVDEDGLTISNSYTIAELCGEEEE